MIPYSDFVRLLLDVSECKTFDQYLAEVGGSVPIDDGEEVTRLLSAMWEMAHEGLTIKNIAAACCTSVRQIGIQLGIPRRTIGNWSAGANQPEPWRISLVAYAVMSDFLEEARS